MFHPRTRQVPDEESVEAPAKVAVKLAPLLQSARQVTSGHVNTSETGRIITLTALPAVDSPIYSSFAYALPGAGRAGRVGVHAVTPPRFLSHLRVMCAFNVIRPALDRLLRRFPSEDRCLIALNAAEEPEALCQTVLFAVGQTRHAPKPLMLKV
jgi:hypothetical protein